MAQTATATEPAPGPGAPTAQTSNTAASEDANKVFAGNLAFTTTEDELKKVFDEAGNVTFIQLIKRGTRSLGYGFVTYETEAEAQKAVTMLNKKEIDGREINVEGAKPQPPPKSAENYSYAEGEEGASTRGRGRGRGGRGRGRGGATARRPRNDEGEEGTADSGKENSAPETGPNGGVSKSAKRRQKKANKAAAAGAEGDVNGAAVAEGEAKPARQPRKPKGPPQGEPSKTLLFVANLPFVFTDEQLKGAFEGFSVKSATVVKRRFGTRTKGFGFVDLENEEQQQRALKEVHGKEVEGRPLSLKIAVQGDDRKAQKDADSEDVAKAEKAAETDPAPAA